MWKNIIVGAAGAIVAVIVLAAAEEIWGWIGPVFGPTSIVPSGAVVAFDGNCPEDGWDTCKEGAGRFLIGSG